MLILDSSAKEELGIADGRCEKAIPAMSWLSEDIDLFYLSPIISK